MSCVPMSLSSLRRVWLLLLLVAGRSAAMQLPASFLEVNVDHSPAAMQMRPSQNVSDMSHDAFLQLLGEAMEAFTEHTNFSGNPAETAAMVVGHATAELLLNDGVELEESGRQASEAAKAYAIARGVGEFKVFTVSSMVAFESQGITVLPMIPHKFCPMQVGRCCGIGDMGESAWHQAYKEWGGSVPMNSSDFACAIPKIPGSWVKRIQALDHAKHYRYNFVGSVHGTVTEYRQGILNFAKENFTDEDYFDIRDAPEGYEPLGQFDHTIPRVRIQASGKGASYDENYYQTMAASKFTFVPRGDHAWSMRYYEAIAAGSLPVLFSDGDLSDHRAWAIKELGYRHINLARGDPLVYNEGWVADNLRKFIKFQTFIQGDIRPAVVQGPPPLEERLLELAGWFDDKQQ